MARYWKRGGLSLHTIDGEDRRDENGKPRLQNEEIILTASKDISDDTFFHGGTTYLSLVDDLTRNLSLGEFRDLVI